MFEVGRSYNVVTLEHGENYEGKWGYYETSTVYEVGAVDGPLIKLLGPDFSKPGFDNLLVGPEDRDKPRDVTILNTANLFFVRADLVQE